MISRQNIAPTAAMTDVITLVSLDGAKWMREPRGEDWELVSAEVLE